MGLPALSETRELNFATMMGQLLGDSGGTLAPYFSFFFASHAREESELALGGWNAERFEGPLAWVSVFEPGNGFWMVGMRNVLVDGEPLDVCRDGDCQAIV